MQPDSSVWGRNDWYSQSYLLEHSDPERIAKSTTTYMWSKNRVEPAGELARPRCGACKYGRHWVHMHCQPVNNVQQVEVRAVNSDPDEVLQLANLASTSAPNKVLLRRNVLSVCKNITGYAVSEKAWHRKTGQNASKQNADKTSGEAARDHTDEAGSIASEQVLDDMSLPTAPSPPLHQVAIPNSRASAENQPSAIAQATFGEVEPGPQSSVADTSTTANKVTAEAFVPTSTTVDESMPHKNATPAGEIGGKFGEVAEEAAATKIEEMMRQVDQAVAENRRRSDERLSETHRCGATLPLDAFPDVKFEEGWLPQQNFELVANHHVEDGPTISNEVGEEQRFIGSRKSQAKKKAAKPCAVRPVRVQGLERKKLLEDKGKLRVRTDRDTLTDLYEQIFERVPLDGTTVEYMAREFSDKEIRVLMSMNKMRINNYNPQTGKYTEKTKHDKIKTLIPILCKLMSPKELRKKNNPAPGPRRYVLLPARKPRLPQGKLHVIIPTKQGALLASKC
eukprot:SAG31_NODE_1371_length_8605_cov_20.357630_2_plen_508_part_00